MSLICNFSLPGNDNKNVFSAYTSYVLSSYIDLFRRTAFLLTVAAASSYSHLLSGVWSHSCFNVKDPDRKLRELECHIKISNRIEVSENLNDSEEVNRA